MATLDGTQLICAIGIDIDAVARCVVDLQYDKELFSKRLVELYGERPETEAPKSIGVATIFCASASAWIAGVAVLVVSFVRLH